MNTLTTVLIVGMQGFLCIIMFLCGGVFFSSRTTSVRVWAVVVAVGMLFANLCWSFGIIGHAHF